MSASAKGTQDVLDSMTMAFSAAKQGKAAQAGLTPVGVEPGGPMLPNDTGLYMSNESLRLHAVDLRKFADDAIKIADALDVLTGLSSIREQRTSVTEQVNAAKAAEKAADERALVRTMERATEGPTAFETDFAAKAAAAQAATFGDAPAITAGDRSWRCPKHPNAPTKMLTSRKKRQYAACTKDDCQETERLGA